MRYLKTARGAALITTILVTGIAGLTGFLALAQASLNRIVGSQQFVEAAEVRLKTYGCLEEVLIQIQADPNFSVPSSMDTSSGTCNFTTSVPAVGELQILVRYTDNDLYFGLDVRVQTDAVEILELYPSLN